MAAKQAGSEVDSDLAQACDWCQKPISASQTLIKCRMLSCKSSYKLHMSCVPLARARGTTMKCQLCGHAVAISTGKEWQEKLLEAFVAGVIPQLILDQTAPRQMAKFNSYDTLTWLFIRVFISFMCSFGVVVGWYIFCWFAHLSHRLVHAGFRVLKR